MGKIEVLKWSAAFQAIHNRDLIMAQVQAHKIAKTRKVLNLCDQILMQVKHVKFLTKVFDAGNLH